MPASLFSAKGRCYLRKRRIPYEERVPGDPRYGAEVIPRIGRWILPVLQTPDGELVQDTVEIIEYLEARSEGAWPVLPVTPRQRVVALLLEIFGGGGVIRPAMHFRWNFDEANLEFIRADFAASLAPGADRQTAEQVFAWASGAMRAATVAVGATAENAAVIERSFEELLDVLERHFASMPYLLGGHPTIADFGLIGPLHAHLARDPHPSAILKRRAPRLWRWVERMTSPDADMGEYLGQREELLAGDAIPQTLVPLLAYAGDELTADLVAQTVYLDAMLAEQNVTEGEVIPYDVADRFIGTVSYEWRGRRVTSGVLPYWIFMLRRLQDAWTQAPPEDRDALRRLFAEGRLEPLLDVRPRRRVDRRGNREVWGATQEPVLPA